MTRRRALVAIHCRASELERDLEESIRLVELAKAGAVFIRPERLPTTDQLHVTHGTPYTLTRLGWEAVKGST